ncbi:hypothetical protein [Puniceibacterium sp. IMCC21224]|uniref:hypothetical protein n=1 Tax=Puniceibacterium sp. IMCC21224 TaxID=1618204 RepID=UPI00065CD0BB|nr:hypothetical protein [Puniceibacterium sp. IMCC21224]KMK66276.1 hypothetical protein IMCC21224_111125 [Puniceibacterium sp. IMCC21224]
MFRTLTRAMRKSQPDPSLLIVGHSHVECLDRAVNPKDRGVHVVSLTTKKHRIKRGARGIDISDMGLGTPDRIVLCLGGNAHSTLGLLNHPEPFALDRPAPGRMLIPEAVMRDTTEHNLRQVFVLARNVRAQFPNSRCLYLNPPPPIGNPEHILAHPGIFRAQLKLGISPPELRLALYRIQTVLYADLAAETGDPLLMAPSSVLDADGFLANDYANNDPTHGNTAYGRVMLDLIQQHFTEAA